MFAGSLAAVRRWLPRATVVFDRFRIVQHLTQAVDTVRRQAWLALAGPARPAFERTRFLWVENPWTSKPPERRRLSALCRLNLPIVRASPLEEDFQRFWDSVRDGWAVRHLAHWLGLAMRSRLEPKKAFTSMIKRHLPARV